MGWHMTWGEERRSFPQVLLTEGVLMGERSQVLEKVCGSQARPEKSIFLKLSILGNHQSVETVRVQRIAVIAEPALANNCPRVTRYICVSGLVRHVR